MTSRFIRIFSTKVLSKAVHPHFDTQLIRTRSTANINLNASGRKRLHTALWPPLVFGELLIALWTYKCIMLIIFQNKLIYLPYIPVGARKESIQEYLPQLLGVDWTTSEVKTPDGKSLSTCVAEIRRNENSPVAILVYFQGNASSMPSRLPFLSRILKTMEENEHLKNMNLKIVAPSYRGYWTSTGRPSQAGLEKDAMAILDWISSTCKSGKPINLILYGHSVGAGVAAFAAACSTNTDLRIIGLILETPFTSVADMLRTLYPQKWLPYYYLTPFLRSSWDMREYTTQISRRSDPPRIMIVQAENDEIVNEKMAPEIRDLAIRNNLEVDHYTVRGALHFECMGHKEFHSWVSAFIARCME